MGMESFFVKLLVDVDAYKDLSAFNSSIIECLTASHFKASKITKTMREVLLINGLIELETCEYHSKYEITLIGCFSCFLTVCTLIEELAELFRLNYSVLSIKIAGEEFDIATINLTDVIRDAYKEKYQWFLDNITSKTFDASPGTFYKQLRRSKSYIGRLLSRF
jgi:hypothetical protein